MRLSRRVERAKEEIIRCNIELRRLHTSIVNEGILLRQTLQRIKSEKRSIYGAVEAYVTRRLRINNLILVSVRQAQSLDGFSGEKTIGRRVSAVTNAPIASDVDEQSDEHEEDDDDEWFDIDDDDNGDVVGNFVNYISDLPVAL